MIILPRGWRRKGFVSCWNSDSLLASLYLTSTIKNTVITYLFPLLAWLNMCSSTFLLNVLIWGNFTKWFNRNIQKWQHGGQEMSRHVLGSTTPRDAQAAFGHGHANLEILGADAPKGWDFPLLEMSYSRKAPSIVLSCQHHSATLVTVLWAGVLEAQVRRHVGTMKCKWKRMSPVESLIPLSCFLPGPYMWCATCSSARKSFYLPVGGHGIFLDASSLFLSQPRGEGRGPLLFSKGLAWWSQLVYPLFNLQWHFKMVKTEEQYIHRQLENTHKYNSSNGINTHPSRTLFRLWTCNKNTIFTGKDHRVGKSWRQGGKRKTKCEMALLS